MTNVSSPKFHDHCYNITRITGCENMNFSELHPQMKSLKGMLWYEFLDRYLETFTTGDLLTDVTIAGDDFMLFYYTFDPQTRGFKVYPNPSDVFEVYDSLIHYRRCFTLQWKPERRFIDYWLLSRTLDNHFLRMYIHTTFMDPTSSVVLGFTKSQQLPSVSSTDFVFSFPKARGRMVKFDVVESKFLPAPFSTNCRDYNVTTADTFAARDQCFESCYGDLYQKEFNRMPQLLRRDMLHKDWKSTTITQTYAEKQNVSRIYEFCKSKCSSQDCSQTNYIFNIMSTTDITMNDTTYQISFTLPSAPTTITRSLPAITMETFITAVCSTFGFWLGISVLSITELIHMFAMNLIKSSSFGDGNIIFRQR
jgi:hypothetical protein